MSYKASRRGLTVTPNGSPYSLDHTLTRKVPVMNVAIAANNPFALMLEPQQVLEAVEGSRTLRSLRQQQYLLLDRPSVPAANADLAMFDAELDDSPDEEFDAGDAPVSEVVDGSHSYQSFPRIFN
jgi:hypothetical protein